MKHNSVIARNKTKIAAFGGMIVLLIFSFWLMFHTFSYNEKTHSITIAFKLWSDFGAHIPLIRSFSLGNNFPDPMTGAFVQYPIFPGVLIRYHFLFYLFVGLLERMGIRIDWALNVPSALGFFSLLLLIWITAKKLFHSVSIACLSVIFFLFNGSLAFTRFFTQFPLSAGSIEDILHVRNFPAFAPWDNGEITAFWNLNIYTNQRHLAIAFALILLFILTVISNRKQSTKVHLVRAFVWGLILGALPFFHQPALLVFAVFIACYFIAYPSQRIFFLATSALTVACVVPQLLLSAGATKSIEWYPGFIIHNQLLSGGNIISMISHILSFWWQNLGLHSLLIVIGFFFIPRAARKALFPIIPLFIIANCFKFSVEVSANHKFFNLVMILGQTISAYVLISLYKIIRRRFHHSFIRLLGYSFISLLFIPLMLSGIIDFFVVYNDTKGAIADIPYNESATWIAANTPPNAVFLNSSYLYHPASIAGRPIFLGWPYFAWSAGYPDGRPVIMKRIYESKNPAVFCPVLRSYNISYVTVEDTHNDPNLPKIDPAYFRANFRPAYTTKRNDFAIYETRTLCEDI